jgi:hypothetical protein
MRKLPLQDLADFRARHGGLPVFDPDVMAQRLSALFAPLHLCSLEADAAFQTSIATVAFAGLCISLFETAHALAVTYLTDADGLTLSVVLEGRAHLCPPRVEAPLTGYSEHDLLLRRRRGTTSVITRGTTLLNLWVRPELIRKANMIAFGVAQPDGADIGAAMPAAPLAAALRLAVAELGQSPSAFDHPRAQEALATYVVRHLVSQLGLSVGAMSRRRPAEALAFS